VSSRSLYSLTVLIVACGCSSAGALSSSERVQVIKAAVLSSLGEAPYGHPKGDVAALCLGTDAPGEPPQGTAAEPLYPVPEDILAAVGSGLREATGLEVLDDSGCKQIPGVGIVTHAENRPALHVTVFDPNSLGAEQYMVWVGITAAGRWGHSDRCTVSASGGIWVAECQTILIAQTQPSNTRLEQTRCT